ncbi:unnamed protein product [Calypogeia fissa]
MELLTQLGGKFGTHCGGLDHFNLVHNGDVVTVPEVANVTLQYEDEELWEHPLEEQQQSLEVLGVTPPLEDFVRLLEDGYQKISYHHTLTTQALKEMKAWIESLLTREAEQNVSVLEREGALEAMAPNDESDITTVQKRGWVDKLMEKKGKRQNLGDAGTSTGTLEKMTNLVKKVTRDSAPEKLLVKKKPKPVSFQGKFDKEAMDALQDIVDSTLDKDKQDKGKIGKGRGKRGATKAGKEPNSIAPNSRAPRPRKTRQAPPLPMQSVIDQCRQAGTLQGPLTPLQTNVLGNIRIGSSEAWGMSPKFNVIMEAFSVGDKESTY